MSKSSRRFRPWLEGLERRDQPSTLLPALGPVLAPSGVDSGGGGTGSDSSSAPDDHDSGSGFGPDSSTPPAGKNTGADVDNAQPADSVFINSTDGRLSNEKQSEK
jgi:hypothetical protein